jgi:hypothetical protein
VKSEFSEEKENISKLKIKHYKVALIPDTVRASNP